MREAEAAIRTLVDTWLAAARAGDRATGLGLMVDDVVFLTPGRAPFGEAAGAAASRERRDLRIEGTGSARPSPRRAARPCAAPAVRSRSSGRTRPARG